MFSKAVEVLVYWEPIAYSEIFFFWKWYPHIGHGSLSCSEFLKPIRHEMHVQIAELWWFHPKRVYFSLVSRIFYGEGSKIVGIPAVGE